MGEFQTIWDSDSHLFISILSGDVNSSIVKEWKTSIKNESSLIKSGSVFKAFLSLRGCKCINMEVHKEMRKVIPYFLADYNFKAGYLNLFPEIIVPLKISRDIQCLAVAHVHHDSSKMEDYQKRFGSNLEKFLLRNN